ncbi:thioredoxin domain-containing protein 11 isoform X1 [Hippocampus zosterae]|uniref:thioredoxin domain-containing protein 11 isoform X1 n=1 Tax=Hippocampus zosterae TaxID=109293 RepID=UPI00223CBE4D|nr:thioredoxin domain-containing protein 11 isoform X1 [Hippocampus zosterae]
MLRRAQLGLRQVLSLMARRPALLCGAVVLGVLLVLAVKFTCSRARNVVAAAPPPLRFFSPESPVVDLYLGQLDQVERLRSVAEVSFVFFYAPWCAHSMAARQEVQLVAKKLAKQVQFVAINCWWSQGKCRRVNHFFKYPIIHLFYRQFGPIEYKGPFVAGYVESFILRVMTPLTYLPSRDAVLEFLSCHEPRVVGFFQFNSSPQPPGYTTYLASALQALKRDFRGVVRFGVVTNSRVAEAISLKEDESVYLHRRFNSSLVFPRWERNFTSRAVCSWVFEHHESVLQWLQPPGTKSWLLEHELTKGAALLLFLPHDPLVSEPDGLLRQVADVALRYHSCDARKQRLTSSVPCCHSVLAPDSTAWCDVCPTSSARCSSRPTLQSTSERFCLHLHCRSFALSYSPLSHHSACCGKFHPQLSNNSKTKEAPSRLTSSTVTSSSDALKGLGCQTNKTLRFYVLDMELNWPLAVRLGAPGKGNSSSWRHRQTGAQGDGSFAAIVNLKDEVHYVLQRTPSATLTESLEAFIMNFSAPYSLLHRHLVGEEPREHRVTRQNRSQQQHDEPPQPLITELTTSSFLSYVMDVEKDVLLFYYTQWCGFCSVLNHVLIQLARLLQRHSGVTLARVNVARNDLPWEFMVDRVPSILFFPRYRKELSVKFPDDLPITLPNLLRFILKHSGSLPDTDKSSPTGAADASGPGSAVLRAELEAVQREVRTLHRTRELLSQQLAQLWRDNRQLRLDARGLEAQNAELRREQRHLEERRREKSRQLAEALRRLRELADASQNLLNQNALLRMVLRALKETAEPEVVEEAEAEGEPPVPPAGSHLAS